MHNEEAVQNVGAEQEEQKPLDEPGALAEALEEVEPQLATPEEAAEGEAPDEVQAEEAPVGGQPRLIVKRNGVETDTVFSLGGSSVIGRFDPSVGPIDVDLGDLPEGVYVSRKHAKVFEEEGVWKVKDLGSSNGTFILRDDFERVEEAELTDGTEFALGNARFVFRIA